MKKFFIAGTLMAAASTSAYASPTTLTYNLEADVGVVCGVYKSDGPTVTVDFGELANTDTSTWVTKPVGSATYRCNSPNGFTRTISSANSGVLKRTGSSGGPGNTIPY